MIRTFDPGLPGVALLLAVAMVTACGSGREDAGDAVPGSESSPMQGATAAPQEFSLAGTTWRLVEIQSMDDAQGTTRPADPSAFTMALNADGTVNMKLDCNRANGTWSHQPGSDGVSGTFSFGLLATTRALCRPPHLDEQISAQAQYVAGYLLRDGRLNLSLMADGGIWVWEPIE